MWRRNEKERGTLSEKGIPVGIGWAIYGVLLTILKGWEHPYFAGIILGGGVFISYCYLTDVFGKIKKQRRFICLNSPEEVLSKAIELLDKMDSKMGVVRMMPVEITSEMFETSGIPSIENKVQKLLRKMKNIAEELPYDWTIYGTQGTFRKKRLSQATREFIEETWFKKKRPSNSWFAIDHNFGHMSLWFFGRATTSTGLDTHTHGLLIFFDISTKLPKTGVYIVNEDLLRRLYHDLCDPFFQKGAFYDSNRAREKNGSLLDRIYSKDKKKSNYWWEEGWQKN